MRSRSPNSSPALSLIEENAFSKQTLGQLEARPLARHPMSSFRCSSMARRRGASQLDLAEAERERNRRQGYRLATSTGGGLTGRRADIILIDDPLQPEETLSKAQRRACNEGLVQTLYSRLNDN